MKASVRSGLLQVFFVLAAAACGGGGGGGGDLSVSHDSALATLSVSAGSLSFAPATLGYAVTVPNGTRSFTVTPTAHDTRATVKVRVGTGAFMALTSGQPSADLGVPSVGSSSTITVRVTAEDGNTTSDYSIALTQQGPGKSSDATLASLSVSAGSLSFAPATLGYAVTLPNGTGSFTVTPTVHDAHATVAVRVGTGTFTALTSGQASANLGVPGVSSSSTITVRVTAEDGTTQDYTITLGQASAASFTVYTIGDSTMADYDPVAYPNQRGWGQMFPQFLTGNAVNAAKNGRSSKSFYTEGSWAAVLAQVKAGDYVFIQFAHNDEKNGGLEGVTGTANEVGTAPYPSAADPVANGDYQIYLRKYVDETRAVGATPVLIAPVVRRYFSGATVTPKGCHDLTGLTTPADHDPSITDGRSLDYVAAMRAVATETGVAFIDLTASTKQLVEQYGPTDAKSLLYISADDTHLQPLGAMMFAQLAVQGLIAQGILVDYLNPAADLVVSPSALDFSSLYVGLTLNKAITITGLALSSDTGNVTVAAPAGFQVSTSSTGTFTQTLQLPYTGGKLAPTTVYVQFQPGAEQAYAGNVTVTPDAGAAESVAVTGTGVAIPSGGTRSQAVWSLTADASCAATGLVTCADETFSELYAKSYQAPATSTTWLPSQPSSSLTQRNSILNTVTPDQWPASEIDIVPTRYVQFTVSPASGKRFVIDSISLWAGVSGGNKMAYRIQYSKQADFGTAVTLLNSPSNASNTMNWLSYTPVVTVEDGETLYVRIFPWYTYTAATGKYLCLQSLTISGSAL